MAKKVLKTNPSLCSADIIRRLLHQPDFEKLKALKETLNIFDIVDSSIDENAYSRFLAYLFDSRRSHGFGVRLFVRWMSEIIRINSSIASKFPESFLESIKNTSVQVEWGTEERRRVDIVVSMQDYQNRAIGVLGIENKVWSVEQTAQLSDYQDAINGKFASISRKALIFLTPDGRKHSTAKDCVDCPVYCAPYSTIGFVMPDGNETSEENAILLQSFQKHLQKKFTGSSPMENEAEKLVRSLYKDPVNRGALRFIAKYIPTPKVFMSDRIPVLLENGLKEKISFSWMYPKNGPREFNYSVGDIGEGNAFFKDKGNEFAGVYYMLLSREAADIGSEITLQVMLNDGSRAAESRAEKLRKALPLSHGGRQWGPWKLIWTGGSIVLTDLEEKDEGAISTLFREALQKTYAPIRSTLKLLVQYR